MSLMVHEPITNADAYEAGSRDVLAGELACTQSRFKMRGSDAVGIQRLGRSRFAVARQYKYWERWRRGHGRLVTYVEELLHSFFHLTT